MVRNCWLSIIIPHYNTPDFLCRLLDSIGEYDDVQVIVVDDHSDQFLAEFSRCQNRFSHVSFLQMDSRKKGAGAARNAGLSHAEGKWLLFADADDVFLPGWYETVSRYLETDYDLVFFMPESKKDDGTASMRHLLYRKLIEDYCLNRYGSEERLRFRFSVPWSKLIRTDVVRENKLRFDEIPYSNDIMFSAKSGYYSTKITADLRSIYCVVEHKGSLTTNKTEEVYLRRMRVICEREKYLLNHLSKDKMDACRRISFVTSTKDALQNGYGIKTIIGLSQLFREYQLPFLPADFNWIIERTRHR